LGYAGEILAPGKMAKIPAERRTQHLVERRLVEPPRGRCFVLRRVCVKPCSNLRFDGGAFRPSIGYCGAIGLKKQTGRSDLINPVYARQIFVFQDVDARDKAGHDG